MNISVGLSEGETYIIVKVAGNIRTNTMPLAPLVELYELGTKLGIRRVLIDATESRNIQTLVDDYEFINNTVSNEPKIYRDMRLAVLISPHDQSRDFIITVAKNAGFNIELFQDREEAIKFLMDKRN